MKEDAKQGDGEFKAQALDWIGNLGRVVLCADNEPGHINQMRAVFPDALALLVQTRHSPGAPAIADGVVAVPGLREGITVEAT